MSSLLPLNPSIDHLHNQAKTLLAQCKVGDAEALKRVRKALTVFRFRADEEIAETIKLSHALEVVAREHGFACWSALAGYVQAERSNYRAMSEAVADTRMEDLTFRSGVARSKGLPEIGTSRVSEYGVRYDVTDYAPAITPQGAKRIRDGGALIQVEDLLPVIAFPEMSDRLYELYLGTDCVTARPIVLPDTMPDRFPKHGLPGFFQVVAPAPSGPLFFLFDASRVHETIIAHEIGHVWVEMVLRIEDYRHPKDQSDLTRTTQFYHIQSFVMDLPVNDMLERRGFDMSVIARHEIEAIHTMAANCARGEKPGNKRILAGVISSLAGSLLEMERFPSKYGESIGTSLELIQRHLPEVFEPAKEYARLHPRRAIDQATAPRNYMAGVGLFLSRAGFAQQQDGEHPYGYANNNPVTYIDPDGVDPKLGDPPPCLTPEQCGQIAGVGPGSGSVIGVIFANCCADCARSIHDTWSQQGGKLTWYHECNHMFVHCISCCFLTRNAGDSCASVAQSLQDRLSKGHHSYPLGPGGSSQCRTQGCDSGIAGAGSKQSCFDYCISKWPFDGGPNCSSKTGPKIDCKGKNLTALPFPSGCKSGE